MCYKSPGPRCSSHAETAVMQAQVSYDTALLTKNPDIAMRAYTELNDAQEAFYMTPKGQEQLTERMSLSKDPAERQDLGYKLEYGILAREEALEAIRAKDAGDIDHKVKELTNEEKAVAADEKYAAERQAEADELETINIGRKARGLMPLSSKNSIALDTPRSGYSTYDSSLTPQAPDLEKISSIVDAIGNGATTSSALGESFNMTSRDGSYYGNGAEYIGLVKKTETEDGSEFSLTANGQTYAKGTPEERVAMLRELVNTTPLMQGYHESGKNREQLEEAIRDTGYSPEVAKRRASSMITWDRKLNEKDFENTLKTASHLAKKLSVTAARNQKFEKEERKVARLQKTVIARDYGICNKHFTSLPANGICSECE